MTTLDDLERWGEVFLAFHVLFADRLARREPASRWPSTCGACSPRSSARTAMRETFGDPEGIGTLEETGFLKKGVASVGVQRQGCGKAESCQTGVFLRTPSERVPVESLTDATSRGHGFLDRRRELPEAW